MSLARIALIGVMAAVTAVCAQIAVPLPFTPVPFTLQVFAVLLTGYLLGPVDGLLSQLVYLGLGALGLPVFARFAGGPGLLLGPTGGFLLAFPLAALVVGAIGGGSPRTPARSAAVRGLLGSLVALAVIYTLGAAWFAIHLHTDAASAVRKAILPFVPFDVIKAILAVTVGTRVRGALATVREHRGVAEL
ncbi:MAG: biotin transporter BioY [Clostridia bacterium]|nr:biotin transporter BioY [Clostridia bacterium]